jgi:DNA-binding transcriptional MerR regulator
MAELAEFSPKSRNGKSDSAFRTISEVAAELDLPQHVLRFWESKFTQIKPMKRGGGRRYYRPEDISLLRGIRDLLYNDGYTIKGVQKLLRQSGPKALADPGMQQPSAAAAPSEPAESAPAVSAAIDQNLRQDLEEVLKELKGLRDLLRGS